ncbi:TnsA endonuclease N-terminal domain-containing protein [Aquitalea aquatilis]|uniref:TnsA endonuclease N-terminal domain-containing protein n=1 Tax=Aquitalea aquatilis TaxID=1537400 RepID=UPI0010BDB2D0|nr:TnsA endonuclease N-terminal domain-containing protein [Aquitalea aquatilis]
MRVRKVVTRRGRHIRGDSPSKKLNRMVVWESPLEKDALMLVELSPGVISYQEQPEEVIYWDGERMCRYVPDVRVNLCDETSLLIEVKPAEELKRPVVKAKYQRIALYLQEQGEHFLILTEHEIRQEPQFSNLRKLQHWYKHPPEHLPSAKGVAATLKGHDYATLQECMDIFGMGVAYALIAKGLLIADLSLVLTPASLVHLPEGGNHAAIYF